MFENSLAELETRRKKEVILHLLNELAGYWIDEQARLYKIPISHLQDPKCSYVRAVGSFGLGLNHSKSDLDAVLMTPAFIKREDLFSHFAKLLKSQLFVQDFRKIENAFVPVLKFTYEDIDVDVTFAVLSLSYVPTNEKTLLFDNILICMDIKSQRSLNSWRVCKFLLNYVPEVDMFREVLTVIKRWAQAKQLYSNACGYLGGITWAIMVARICKMLQNSEATLVDHLRRFFFTYGVWWNWNDVLFLQTTNDSASAFKDLNEFHEAELYSSLRGDFMSIVTPCYPVQSCSFKVTKTTFNSMITAMKEAYQLFPPVSGSCNVDDLLDSLCKPLDITSKYTSFVILTAGAPNSSELKRWRGVVESLFGRLINRLEKIELMKSVCIYPGAYLNLGRSTEVGESCSWIVGVDHEDGPHSEKILEALLAYRSDLFVHAGNDREHTEPEARYSLTFQVEKRDKLREKLKLYNTAKEILSYVAPAPGAKKSADQTSLLQS